MPNQYTINPNDTFTHKQCRTCKRVKLLSEFGRMTGRKLDKDYRCKLCERIRNRNRKRDPIKERRKKLRYILKYPARHKARMVLNNALQRGIIKKQKKCSICGKSGRIHGHHPDYRRPLEVTWLCPIDHKAVHAR